MAKDVKEQLSSQYPGKFNEEELHDSVRRNMLFFAQASFVERYPDVRDGLKPIHRRIIYSIDKLGLTPKSSYMKCGKVVGVVMGDYHPHGDGPIYDTLVAMAQPFTMNYKIVDGQGNFGNLLGDSAAANRYTECRAAEYSKIFTNDLSEETVHFVPNYSSTCLEPSVLPTMLPNILINGNYTIGAAAFNSSIPPHNLAEVIDVTIELMRKPKITNEYIGGKLLPDFPFGGIIVNPEEIREFYQHGTSTSLKMTSKYHIDEEEREIVITELPYLVDGNTLKAEILKKFPKLKEIGIDSVEDDCDDLTMTMSIIIKYMRSANPHKIVETLQKRTSMSNSAQLIFTCTVDGRLMENCTIKSMLSEWIKFRREVIRKVITNSIQKIYREMHILEALISSYDRMKEIIGLIEKATSKDEIVNTLIQKFRFSILQAQAIVNMKLYELSKMGKDALIQKYNELKTRMDENRAKLNAESIDNIIIGELKELKTKFGRPRRTQIVSQLATAARAETPIDLLISKNAGNSVSFIRKDKLLSKESSGKIISGSRSNEVKDLLSHNTVDDVLYAITNFGLIYKVDQIKSYLAQSTIESTKWETLNIQISPRVGETIVSLLSIPKCNIEDGTGDIILIAEGNIIKRMSVSVIPTRIQTNGTKFIQVPETNLNFIQICKYVDEEVDGDLIAYATSSGHIHVYPYSQLRDVGKAASGISATTSNLPITDIILCRATDIIYMCQSNGECKAIKVSDIPQKRRNTIPYKLIVASGKKHQEPIVSLRKHIPNAKGILICGKDGVNCVGSDEPILNSVSSGALSQIIPENITVSQISSVIEV